MDPVRNYLQGKARLQRQLVIIIILLMTLGQLATTIYLPSMPAMVVDLKANETLIQYSLIFYITAYGLSQFFYGPLSDIYGRRIIAIIGLCIFLFASVISIISDNIWIFLFSRILQGLGLGCGDTIGRAILCEKFESKEFVRAASFISMAATITPVLAPIIGGYLQTYFNWHVNFVAILLYGIIVFLIVFFSLEETNDHKGNYISLKGMLSRYRFIFMNRIFLGFFIPGSVSFFGEAIYNMLSPFLLQTQIGLTPVEFGWSNMAIIAGMLVGAIISHQCTHRVSHAKMVFFGLEILLISGVLMLIFSLFHWMDLYSILGPMVLFTVGIGIIYPNTNMGALAPFTNMAGTAGALQGGMQMFGIGLIGLGVGVLPTKTQLPLALMLSIAALIGILSFLIFIQPSLKQPTSEKLEDKAES